MKRVLKIVMGIILIVTLILVGINIYVIKTSSSKIIAQVEGTERTYGKDFENLKENPVDCLIVPGASVKEDGTPSLILQQRLDFAFELYEEGVAKDLLLSGDYGQLEYNEVGAMEAYLLSKGIPGEHIYVDYAGFSTYETMYRAKEIFQVENGILVTQRYHLYRGVYIGNALGMNIYGAGADYEGRNESLKVSIREAMARIKDFVLTKTKPEPQFLGDPIPIGKGQDR